MQKICLLFSGSIINNEDLVTAMNQFITNFEAENKTKISSYGVVSEDVTVLSTSGIICMEFVYEKDGDTATSTVILKIPSIAPLFITNYLRN